MKNIETRKKVTEKILETFIDNQYSLEEMQDELMILLKTIYSAKSIFEEKEYLQ